MFRAGTIASRAQSESLLGVPHVFNADTRFEGPFYRTNPTSDSSLIRDPFRSSTPPCASASRAVMRCISHIKVSWFDTVTDWTLGQVIPSVSNCANLGRQPKVPSNNRTLFNLKACAASPLSDTSHFAQFERLSRLRLSIYHFRTATTIWNLEVQVRAMAGCR